MKGFAMIHFRGCSLWAT